jgi:electron transfer flavoprotein alpha subunit
MDLSFLEQLLGEPVEEEEGYRNVWACVVAWQDQLRDADVQLVGKARELADSLGAYVIGLVLGEPATEDMGRELVAHGADRVYVAKGYPTDKSLAEFLDRKKPEILLFNDSAGSRKFAPQVAQRLDASLVTHAVDLMLDAENRSLVVAMPLYRGVAYQVIACHAHPQMATVQPGVFPTPYRDDWRDGDVEMIELTWQPQPPLNPVQPPEYQVPLKKADIVIAGGRGVREAGWPLVEDLATAFAQRYPQRRVAVAGSRGAVDEGWIGQDRMVDMTGQVVAPDLYIACGIRGTFLHFGAMEKARCIVAINRNREAPIFKHADYGIVGDVAEVIPALVEALER